MVAVALMFAPEEIVGSGEWGVGNETNLRHRPAVCSLTIGVVGTAGATAISQKAADKQYLAITAPLNAASE